MKMGHSGVCGASYIVEVLNIVCANSQQHVHATRMFKKGYSTHVGICKHIVPHYWYTSFIPMSWSMLYIIWYVGACTLGTHHVYWHGITVQLIIQPGIALFILMCISHCIIFIYYSKEWYV